MGRLSELTLSYLIDLDILKRIREDWVKFYHIAYNSEEFRSRFGFIMLHDDELKERALTAGEQAVNFKPHGPITGTIERISLIFHILRLITLIVAVLGWAAVFAIFEFAIGVTTQVQSVLLSSIPFDIWLGLMIYFQLLKVDDSFVQEFNRKLRFGPGHVVRAGRESEQLFGYYLWNNSLTDRRKAPSLLILNIILYLSEWMYNQVMEIPRNNLEKFIDTRKYREAFRTAMKIQFDEYVE